MPLIGLAGYMQSGKTTCAKHLNTEGWTRVAFADALKEELTRLGWDGIKDKRGRRLLQQFGQTMRGYNPDYWIKRWLERYYHLKRIGIECIVCDDVRYPNEVECIRRLGGCVVRIDRYIRWPWWPKHKSERRCRADYIIKNKGSIEDMLCRLDMICVT
jgi:dephospho-CoA kinase